MHNTTCQVELKKKHASSMDDINNSIPPTIYNYSVELNKNQTLTKIAASIWHNIIMDV